jgi:hypothetical protein
MALIKNWVYEDTCGTKDANMTARCFVCNKEINTYTAAFDTYTVISYNCRRIIYCVECFKSNAPQEVLERLHIDDKNATIPPPNAPSNENYSPSSIDSYANDYIRNFPVIPKDEYKQYEYCEQIKKMVDNNMLSTDEAAKILQQEWNIKP